MNPSRILTRALWLTLLLGAIAAGVLWYQTKTQLALGTAFGSLWAAANLRVLEGLLRAMVVEPGTRRRVSRLTIWFLLKMAVYVVAVWLLIVAPFPVIGLAYGLTVMLISLLLAGVTARSANDTHAPRRGDDAHA